MSLRRPVIVEISFAVLTLLLVVPLWSVRYPPFQDFPQYVALAATLAEYNSPTARFDHFFYLNVDTYTLLAPWLAAVLAKLFGPLNAAKLVVSLVIVATPWAVRVLLKVLGRPHVYSLFVLPLAYNAHVAMGFVSYVVGVTLMLWGFVFGVLSTTDDRRTWKVALGLVSIACLYSHILPFAFLVTGLMLVIVGSGPPRSWLRLAVPLAPALLLSLRGFAKASSGWQALPSGLTGGVPNCPIYDSTRDTFASMVGWINDILHAEWDERVLLGLFVAGMFIVLIGTNYVTASDDPKQRRQRLCLGSVGIVGFGLYFVMPRTCAWIWPIHARFLFIGIMLWPLLLPVMPLRLLQVLGLGLAITSVAVTFGTARAFLNFEHELGDLEPALARIPEGSAVATLTVDKRSQLIKSAGFHHFGAYCQAERGGLAMFTFGTMHHWPIRIRPELGIPEPSWEFQFNPAAIRRSEIDWAEYVLTRGDPPAAVKLAFKEIYVGTDWRVFGKK